MDFWSNMSRNEQIIIVVATISLVIAIAFVFFRKKDSPYKKLQSPEPHHHHHHHDDGQTIIGDLPSEQKGVLVMFFAPWCGHCKNMAPVWEEFMQNFDGYNGVKLLKINGSENEQLCQLHNVAGFPTIKYCPNGLESAEGVVYSGDRSLNSLAQFLQQNA